MLRIKDNFNNKTDQETKSFRTILHDVFRKSKAENESKETFDQNLMQIVDKLVSKNEN